MEFLDSKDSQAQMELQGHLDLRDSPDQTDSKEFLDSLALLECKVQTDHKDRLVSQVFRVKLGHLVHLVILETQAEVVRRDRMALLGSLELEENKVFEELPVLMVRLVTGAVMAAEVHLVTEVLKVTQVGLDKKEQSAHVDRRDRKVLKEQLVLLVIQAS